MPKLKPNHKFEILKKISVESCIKSLQMAFSDSPYLVELKVVDKDAVNPFTIKLKVTTFSYRDQTGEKVQIEGIIVDTPNLNNKEFVGHCWIKEDRIYNFGHLHIML